MRRTFLFNAIRFFVFLSILVACTPAQPLATPVPPTGTAPAAAPETLSISVLYPLPDAQIEMGQLLKVILRVSDEAGEPSPDAQVSVAITDPSGKQIASLPAQFGSGDVYRTEAWNVPHHMQAGNWTVRAMAVKGKGSGQIEGSFTVTNSTSETLLQKYGFWLDAPTLRGIVPSLFAEQGDAKDGRVMLGGTLGSQHILPANWVEINWRSGDFHLNTPEDARRFMIEQVGNFGITPIRAIGPFVPVQFKQWQAWQADVRGQVKQDQVEWLVFYAPEVDKTYSISTTVVQPPAGSDPHEFLRSSFTLYPDMAVSGVAPEPLPHLLPGPELVSPPLGEIYTGLSQPIVLTWKPVKQLEQDEYYEVHVDYNRVEANISTVFTTRETSITLPESLYEQPNCSVFNWQVTLKRQTGVDGQNQPVGEALSYPSLYAYVRWIYPLGQAPDDQPSCPNAQY